MARAAADREAVGESVGRLRTFAGVQEILGIRVDAPAVSRGAALGLSALLLASPIGKMKFVRGGVAAFQILASLRKMFSRS